MGSGKLDSKISWTIAVACACMNFLIMIPIKVSGVFFVEILDRYNVSRSLAIYPSFTLNFVRCSSGPIVGYLAERFGLDKIMILGSVLSAVGISACFFAEDIVTVTVFLGIIHASGVGLNISLLPRIMKMHFKKYVALAYGVTQSGACFGSFFTPPLLMWIFRTYGTSGGFLIIGAVVLNTLPIVLAINILSPRQFHGGTGDSIKSKEFPEVQTQKGIATIITVAKSEDLIPSDYKDISLEDSNEKGVKSIEDEVFDIPNYPENEAVSALFMNKSAHGHIVHEETLAYPSGNRNSTWKSETKYERNIEDALFHGTGVIKHCNSSKDSSGGSPICTSVRKVSLSSYLAGCECAPRQIPRSNGKILPPTSWALNVKTFESLTPSNLDLNRKKVLRSETPATESKNIKSEMAKRSLSIFMDMTLWIVILTQSSYIFVLVVYWTTIIDFSRDKNIDRSKEVYLLMNLAASEIIGRLGLAWVTDGNYLTKTNFCFISLIIMSVSCSLTAWTAEFHFLMISIFLFGLISGGLMSVFPTVIFEFFESDKHTMALASRYFLFGPLSFLSKPVIGYFRGTLGSYEWVYHTQALLLIACAILSELIPVLARRRDEKKKNAREVGNS